MSQQISGEPQSSPPNVKYILIEITKFIEENHKVPFSRIRHTLCISLKYTVKNTILLIALLILIVCSRRSLPDAGDFTNSKGMVEERSDMNIFPLPENITEERIRADTLTPRR